MDTFCNEVHSDVLTLWLVSSFPPIKICLDYLKCLHLPFMCASMKLLNDIIWEVKSRWKKVNPSTVFYGRLHFLNLISSIEEVAGHGLFFDGIYPRCRNRLDNLFGFITPWHDIDNYVISSRLVLNAKIKPHWLYSQRNCE